MIIKRNEITKFIELGITKEEKRLLNEVTGLRPRFINLLSVLADFITNDGYNNNGTQVKFNVFVPEKMKEFFKWYIFKYNWHYIPYSMCEEYAAEIRKCFFDYMLSNTNDNCYNEIYLNKVVANLLKIAKLNIDDFS